MMKKLYSSLLLIFCSLLVVNAQVPKGMGTSDLDAKKLLDGVSAKFKTYKTVEAKFTLKIENGQGKSIGSKSGTVYMKGSKYRISLTDQDIYSDGTNVWTFDKAANEVSITKLDPSTNSITPQKLFTNFYDKDFLYKLNGNSTMLGKKVKEVELTPVDKSKVFHKVLLYLNNNDIVTTKIYEKSGNRYTYSTSGLLTNGNIPDNKFVFDIKKHPNVDVVDLR